MRTYQYTTTIRGDRFHGILCFYEDKTCHEHVTRYGDMGGKTIHEAEFPLSNLGSGSRDEYCRVMTASVADAFHRAAA